MLIFVAVIKKVIRCIAAMISNGSLSAIRRKRYPVVNPFYLSVIEIKFLITCLKNGQGYSSQISTCPSGRSSFCGAVCYGEAPPEQKVMADSVRIMVDIRMSNGIHIQQGNLDFEGLKRLVGNLEVLC